MKKPKAKQLSHTDVARLVDGLRTTVAFIEANIPPDVITTKQTYGLEKTRAAIHLTPDIDENVSHMGLSLLWAIDFVMRNYEGECDELADAMLLLEKLGLFEMEAVTIQ